MTSERRHLLVVASQCAAETRLTDLADSAKALTEVLSDPDLGACLPGLPDGTSLLLYEATDQIDATALKIGVNSAIEYADEQNAVLVLAFLGHGFVKDGTRGLYFMAPTSVPDAQHKALNIPVLLNEATGCPGVRGVFAVVDTCQAAGAQPDFRDLAGQGRLSLLAASSIDQQAYSMRLTKELVRILRQGIAGESARLTQEPLAMSLRAAIIGQTLHTAGIDTGHETTGLWLAQNRRHEAGAAGPGQVGGSQLARALKMLDPRAYAEPRSWTVEELETLRTELSLMERTLPVKRAKQAVVNMIVFLHTTSFLRKWQGNGVTTASLRWALARRNPGSPVLKPPPRCELVDEVDVVDHAAFHHPSGDPDCRRSMVAFVLLLAKAAQAATGTPPVSNEDLEQWAVKIDARTHLHNAAEAIRAERPDRPLRLVVSLHASTAGDWPSAVEGWLLQGGVQAGRTSVSLERPDQDSVTAALQDLIDWVDDQFGTDELKQVDIAAPSALLLRWHPEEVVVDGTLLGAAYEVTTHWSGRIAPTRGWRWVRKAAKARMIELGRGGAEAPIDWMTRQECLNNSALKASFERRQYFRGVGLAHDPSDDAELMDLLFCYSPVVVWPERNAELDADRRGRLDEHWDALPEAFTQARRQRWRGGAPHDLAGIRATWDDMEWLSFCERADAPRATDTGRER